MGFADAYLQKAGLRQTILEPESHPALQLIVTIPVYNESGLERCLDSLFQCTCAGGTRGPGVRGTDDSGKRGIRAEVLILINAPADAPEEVLEQGPAAASEELTVVGPDGKPVKRWSRPGKP